MVLKLVILSLLALVALYTVNYGRWALRHKLVRGALGLFVLAALTVLIPALMLFVRG